VRPFFLHFRMLERALVLPGDWLGPESNELMASHGLLRETESCEHESFKMRATQIGIVNVVNKLALVAPVESTVFAGQVGDVIIGRVISVEHKCWKIDCNSFSNATLQLSYVNLPGGELRRRCEDDERAMREYLIEGDLISAEVQTIYNDGRIMLHTRSLKYGKLGQGVLVRVLPSLIKRCKTHFSTLPCGVTVIFGSNGSVWVESTEHGSINKQEGALHKHSEQQLKKNDIRTILRVKMCTEILNKHRITLFDTTIACAYDISNKYDIKELSDDSVQSSIAKQTMNRVNQDINQ